MKKYIKKWLGIDVLEMNDKDTLADLEDLCRKTAGLGMGEAPEHNSKLEFIFGVLSALEKKVGKVDWHWEDDKSIAPEKHPQVRVWSIKKKK